MNAPLPLNARALHAQYVALARTEIQGELTKALEALTNVVDADQAIKFALPHLTCAVETIARASHTRSLAREEADSEGDHDPA